MRWRECVDRGLVRSAPEAKERVPGSLESAARFLRAAEKNVVIEEYEMAHLAAYNSAFHSVRAFSFCYRFLPGQFLMRPFYRRFEPWTRS